MKMRCVTFGLLCTVGACAPGESAESFEPRAERPVVDEPIEMAPPQPRVVDALDCLSDHPDELDAISRMHDTATQSVVDWIRGNRIQHTLINGIINRVFTSNPQFFDQQTLLLIEQLHGDVRMAQLGGGAWRLQVGPSAIFDLSFFLPGTDEPLLADVFALENYLTGVNITTALSFNEMTEDPDAVNEYRLTWTGYGPLGHVMFPMDERPAERVFVLRASLNELTDPEGEVDYGPLEKIVGLTVHAEVRQTYTQGQVWVEHRFGDAEASLETFCDPSSMPFVLHDVIATEGPMTLHASGSELNVSEALDGILVYTVSGASIDGIRVVDEYPTPVERTAWCPDAWADAPYAQSVKATRR